MLFQACLWGWEWGTIGNQWAVFVIKSSVVQMKQ